MLSGIRSTFRHILKRGVNCMKKSTEPAARMEPRLNPQTRLCPQFDSVGIALFPVADPGEMGVRVLDDCCEDHIM